MVDAEIKEMTAAHEQMTAVEFPRIFWIESEFRLALLQAESAYVHQLVEEIRTGSLGGAVFWIDVDLGLIIVATLPILLAAALAFRRVARTARSIGSVRSLPGSQGR